MPKFNVLHEGQKRFLHPPPGTVVDVAFAGAQGGKTEVGCIAMLNEARQVHGKVLMVLAPTYKMLVQSTLHKLKEIGRKAHSRWFTKWDDRQRMEATDIQGNLWLFRSTDDPNYLRGPTLEAAWFDEARVCQNNKPYHILEQRTKRIYITTTLATGWLILDILKPWEAGSKRINVVKWRSVDNPGFDKSRYEHALRYEDENWVRMEYDADVTMVGGLVFPEFNEQDHVGIVEYKPKLPIYWGQDFGIANANFISYWQIDPDIGEDGYITMIDEQENRMVALPEILTQALDKSYLDTENQVRTLPKPEVVFCDPSGKFREKIAGIGTAQYMAEQDLTVFFQKDWNTAVVRMKGINEMHRLLRTRMVKFDERKCWRMIQAFGLYSRRVAEQGEVVDERPIKDGVSDHRLESAFYFLLGRPHYFWKNDEEEVPDFRDQYTGF